MTAGMSQRVVVINGIRETEEVLRAVFGARGYEVSRLRQVPPPDSPRSCERPQVVVVDLEDDEAADTLSGEQNWRDVPRVMIGPRTATRGETVRSSDICYLPKPFQYPELVQAIERLLEAHAE